MTDPLRQFEAEHEVALARLALMERAAEALQRGAPTAAHLATLRDGHAFVSTVVRTHNENEEVALFTLMGEDTPVGMFVEEHRVLRQMEAQLEAALAGADAVTRAPPIARDLVDLLSAHIARENEVLFPMARTRLGTDGLAAVARRLAALPDPAGATR
jgi:hemerythrin-like domain-containing protein